jgi:hypothetical protein
MIADGLYDLNKRDIAAITLNNPHKDFQPSRLAFAFTTNPKSACVAPGSLQVSSPTLYCLTVFPFIRMLLP